MKLSLRENQRASIGMIEQSKICGNMNVHTL